MSIKLKIDKLSLQVRQKITKDLNFKVGGGDDKNKKKNNFFRSGANSYIKPYLIDKETSQVFLPFNYTLTQIPESSRPDRSIYSPINIKFQQSLRDGQKEVKDEIIATINKTGSCVLSFYPGFGKTSLSIYLASKIRLKTLVIVHRLVLIDQWIESISKFCPGATYGVIKPKFKKEHLERDFLVVNAINVEKIGAEAFRDIGFLVVDEIHTIATETLSKSLFYITPRYLVGLSATPTRPDGMESLLDVYFGTIRITKKLHRAHTVYKIETDFEPEVRYTNSGTVDWNSIIEFQSGSVDRNNMIVDIVQKFGDRYILILCKRICQAEYLIKKLQELGDNVTSLIGSATQYDRGARVMVATVQKCGVGFDFSKLNTLILAADVQEYFVQYLGRIMRTQEDHPLVFDIVDKNSILKRHFSTRKKVYLGAGGVIKKYGKGANC